MATTQTGPAEADAARQRRESHALLDALPDEKLVAVRSLLAVLVEPPASTGAPVGRNLNGDVSVGKSVVSMSNEVPHGAHPHDPEWQEMLKHLSAKAEEMGILTEADVERVIDELRAETSF